MYPVGITDLLHWSITHVFSSIDLAIYYLSLCCLYSKLLVCCFEYLYCNLRPIIPFSSYVPYCRAIFIKLLRITKQILPVPI